MVLRLQQIDDTNRHDHFYLADEDECYYLYEYTAGAGWKGGDTNQLIHNLQKKRGDGGYHYKAPAIARCARDLSRAMSPNWLSGATLVPVPPSKIKSDPLFDDRIGQVCRAIRCPGQADVREIVEQITSTDSFKGGHRKPPDELAANYQLVADELAGAKSIIGVIDDVLTTGSHFKAVKSKILLQRPDATVVGIFVARRAIPNPFTDVTIDDLLQ